MQLSPLRIWAKKLIYGWLIIWVCGVSPLIYFGSLSSHQGIEKQISFLQQIERAQKLQLALAALSAEQQAEQMSRYLQLFGVGYFSASTHAVIAVASSLYKGFNWAMEYIIPFWNELSLFGWVVWPVLLESSVWLPPPKKPPSFLYSLGLL